MERPFQFKTSFPFFLKKQGLLKHLLTSLVVNLYHESLRRAHPDVLNWKCSGTQLARFSQPCASPLISCRLNPLTGSAAILCTGWLDVIPREAWSFCRTRSNVGSSKNLKDLQDPCHTRSPKGWPWMTPRSGGRATRRSITPRRTPNAC